MQSTCRKCDTVFGSLSAFDKHQTQDGDVVTCHEPEDRGLIAKDDGVVRFPAPDNAEEWRGNDERAAWQGHCRECERPMTKKPGRGRPPASCGECGGKGILL